MEPVVPVRTGPDLCASILALCLSGAALWKLSGLPTQELWGELNRLSTEQAQLQSRVGYLDQQQAFEGLLEDFTVTAQALEDLSGARVLFTGTPERWNAQDTGILSVRREGREVARGQCTWNGTVLEAEVELPAADGYEYYFLLLHQDGAQEQKNITGGVRERNIINIAQGLSFYCDFDFEGGYGRTAEGEPWYLHASGYRAYIKRPALLAQNPDLEAVEVILYKNGQEAARTPLEITYDPGVWRGMEWDRETGVWSGESEEMNYRAEVRLDPVLLVENLTSRDVVEAVLEIRVKDGPTWRETVETWDPEELW